MVFTVVKSGTVLIVAIADLSDVEKQLLVVLCDATKYLVVAEITGVVNVAPVPKTVPIVDESANQLNVVLAGTVALKVTDEDPQPAALTDTVTAVGKAL